MRSPLLLPVLMALCPVVATAQPMAENIAADDVIYYVGWRGAQAMRGDYERSKFKTLMDMSSLTRFLEETLPKALVAMAEDEPFMAGALKVAKSISGPMWKHPSAICFAGVHFEGKHPEPRIAILCKAGDDAESRKQFEEGIRIVEQWIRKSPVLSERIHIGLTQINDILVLEIGPSVGIEPNPAARAPRPTLAQDAAFRAAVAKVQKDPAMVMYLHGGNLQKFVATAAQKAGPMGKPIEMMNATIGLSTIKCMAASAGFKDTEYWTEMFVAPGDKAQGMLGAVLGAAALSDEAIKLVPQSAAFFAAQRLDTQGLCESIGQLMRLMMQMQPAPMAHADGPPMPELPKLDVDPALWEGLGAEWVTYTAPEIAGNGLMGLVVANRVNDPAKVQKGMLSLQAELTKVMKAMTAVPPPMIDVEPPGEGAEMRRPRPVAPPVQPKIDFRTVQSGDLTIHYLAMPVISPAWAVKDNVLYMGLFPQVVASAADFGSSKGKSASDNPKLADLLKKLGAGEKPISIHFCDLPKGAPDAYPVSLLAMRLWLGMADMTGMNTPEMLLPPLSKVMPLLSEAGAVMWRDADGWRSRSVAPFPGAMAMGSPLQAFGGELHAIVQMGSMVPMSIRTQQQAQSIMCLSNLRQIAMGCHMYANDNKGQMPQKLGDLVPNHLKDAGVFVCPRAARHVALPAADADKAAWVNANCNYVYLGAGKRVTDIARPDQTVLLHEKPGAGHKGKLGVVFFDGHAESVTVNQLGELLQPKAADDRPPVAPPPAPPPADGKL